MQILGKKWEHLMTKCFKFFAQSEDNVMPPMDCDVELEAFQRVGPSSSDAAPQGRTIVNYWPCKYTRGFDRRAMREARRQAALKHYAAGAEGGYRYIMTNSGTDREQDVDFLVFNFCSKRGCKREKH